MANQIDTLIYQEQIRLLYKNTELIVIAQLLAALAFYLVFWNLVAWPTLLAWGVVFLALTSFRFYNYRAFMAHQSEPFDAHYWEKRFIIGTLLVGTMWGLLFILVHQPQQPEYLVFIVSMACGIIGGGSAYLSASFKAFVVFLTPAILPMILVMFLDGRFVFIILGVPFFVYFLVLLIVTRTYYRNILEALRLRFENLELIKRLEIEKQRAQSSQSVAEQAVLAKDRFLAAASHDLRQPLHAQGLYINAIEANVSDHGKPQLDALRATNDALSKLLSSLLDVSRLNAGIVEVNPVHARLQNVLRPIYEEYQSQARAKQLQLSLSCPPERIARIDTTLLERIVRNLLSNAIRYTDKGNIWLSCDCNSAETITLTVRDTGIGIPKHEQDNIFQEYHQLHNPERDRDKGLGLGLAIVKKLCDLMQLPLRLQSTPGEGSCFCIDIPRGSEDKIPAPHTQKAQANQVSGIKVMVVDDENTILSGMQESLSGWGYEVITAESAEEAQEKLTDSPDLQLIIADYRLRNEQTGVDAIHAIRRFLGNEAIPAIIITGDTSKERLQEAKQSGFVLLHKPVAPGVLRNTLNIVLEPATSETRY